MYRLPCMVFIFLLVSWSAGCAPNKSKTPPLAKVSGTVKLDGKPMDGGEVRFAVTGQPPKSIEIKNGAFSGEVFVGKNQIEVLWEKDGPPNPTDPSTRMKINAISDKFSGPSSVLNAEIGPGGAPELKYEVTSK